MGDIQNSLLLIYRNIVGSVYKERSISHGNFLTCNIHTEQIIDYLRMNGYDILTTINSKSPCQKCAFYIRFADNVFDMWKRSVNIGFKHGWRGTREDFQLDCFVYEFDNNGSDVSFMIKTQPNNTKYITNEGNTLYRAKNVTLELDRYAGTISFYTILSRTKQFTMTDKCFIVKHDECNNDMPILVPSSLQNEKHQSDNNVDGEEIITVETKDVILPEAEEDASDQFSTWNAKQALRNADIAEKIKANNAKIQAWFDERCNIA